MTPTRPMRARRATLALGACALASTTPVATAAAPAATTAAAPAATTAAAPAAPKAVAPAAHPRTPSRVTIDRRRLDVRVGSTASVTGVVRAHAPQLVRLQRRTDAGWTTIASDRPDARGHFSLRHRAGEAGSQRVRVRYSGDERNRLATRTAGRLNAFRSASASWYGPGLVGGRTACGSTLRSGVLGVAHKSLPCGTRLTLRKGDRTVRVTVIDRGPFVAGREFDLTPAVKRALSFGSTGTVGTTA